MGTPANDTHEHDLPIVIVGSGPIGLAMAAHLAWRTEPFILLESEAQIAASVAAWGHVRLFTPWRYSVDPEAVTLLEASGWYMPDPDAYPTGHDLRTQYLEPLATLPDIASSIRLGHRVTAIARQTLSKLEEGRTEDPFLVEYGDAQGRSGTLLARAVVDASGSWKTPNPIGSNGRPVPGEGDLADRVTYRIPDIAGADRAHYAGQRVLVVGSGHSALTSLAALADLRNEAPGTEAHWALRRQTSSDALSGCDDDVLTERTLVQRDIRDMVANQRIVPHPETRITRLSHTDEGIVAWSGATPLPPVDRIVVATGFRPDHAIAQELRLDLQSVFESTYALAPLIDPDANACGTVPPHGVTKLAHPEPGYYVIGMKSYGRAPTFLLYTGYEQVRSVACALSGDREGALEVRLTLPERGLCAACTAFLDERDGACGCGGAGDDVCCPDDGSDASSVVDTLSSAA
jgi:thioredoxin reductase